MKLSVWALANLSDDGIYNDYRHRLKGIKFGLLYTMGVGARHSTNVLYSIRKPVSSPTCLRGAAATRARADAWPENKPLVKNAESLCFPSGDYLKLDM